MIRCGPVQQCVQRQSRTWQQQCVFTTTAGKKRRRSSRFDRPHRGALTIREQQRMLVETNIRRKRSDVLQQSEDLVNVATGRLDWLRHSLYSYWNPDYATQQNTGDNSNAAGAIRVHTKYKLIMDRRWWIWNIAFALLPAVCIGLYCEFRAKPRMLEFHRLQQVAQQRSTHGEEWYQEQMHKVLVEEKETNSTSVVEFFTRFTASVWELFELMTRYYRGELTDEINGKTTGQDENFPKSANLLRIKTSQEQNDQQTPVDLALSSAVASTTDPRPTPAATTTTTPEEADPTLQVLLARVEELERQVQASSSSSSQEDQMSSTNELPAVPKVAPVPTTPQSRIRQRMNASLQQQLNEKQASQGKHEHEKETKEGNTTLQSMAEQLLQFVTQELRWDGSDDKSQETNTDPASIHGSSVAPEGTKREEVMEDQRQQENGRESAGTATNSTIDHANPVEKCTALGESETKSRSWWNRVWGRQRN